MTKRLTWIAAGILIAVAVGVFAVWLPSAIKKLGLFSCLLGCVIGFVAWKLKQSLGYAGSKSDRWVIFILATLSETIRIAESYRVHLRQQQKDLAAELEKAPALIQIKGTEIAEQVQLCFADFLAFRYSAIPLNWETTIGNWGCYLVFVTELLLAGGSALLAFRHLLKENQQLDKTSSKQLTDSD